MIPILFKEDEQVFTHNGIGALYESLSCDVLEEENGAFTMELEYPVDGEWFSEIKDFRIIQAKPNDIDEPHNFRIYEIEKSIDELSVYVRANTRTNDLGNNLITNYARKGVTPQQAMDGIKNNLIEPTNFDLISDIQTRSNVDWTRINPLNAIVGTRGSLVDIWGGQIKRTNTAIHLYSRRGRDNVVTIRPGKNIEGLNMTVSTAGLVTKILPTFSYRPVDVPKYQMVTLSDGTKEKRRVNTSGATTLRDDITVLGDVVSSQYVDNYPTNYWSSVDYSDDNELRDTVDNYIDTKLEAAENSPTILNMSGFENDLKNFVKTELDKKSKQYFTNRSPGVDKPTVRVKVDMLQLSDSPDWEEFKDLEQIGLTDTLDVWVDEYDIDVEVRVTSLTYDSIAEQVTKFNAGSDKAPRRSAMEKRYDDLTKATDDYITSFKNGVQNVMRNTADGLNRKFEGYTEPPAELSSEGDIWFKEIGEGKVEIWIHDGTYWQPLMTEDFGKKLEAEVDAAMLDAEEALLKANEVSDDINTAIQNAGFTSLPEAILEIQGKMDSDRFDQEILDIVTDVNSAKTDASQALTEVQNKVDTFDFDNTVGIINTGIQDAMDEAELATNTLRDSTGQLIKSQDLKVDIDGITSSLTSYAKTTDLNGLATETFVTNKGYQTAAQVSSTLGAYAKTTDLNGLVSQTWVENKGYATASEVSSELSSYAKSSDLTGLATESYVTTRGYQTASQISTTLSAYEKTSTLNTKLAGKANVGDIPSLVGYAKESWVENKSYATAASVTTSLKAYEKITDVNAKLADKADIDDIPDITGLASETWVENKSYATAASVTTQLSSYAKTSQLTGLATETFVTNKGYQTAAQVTTTLSSYAKTSQLTGLATETFVTSKGYQTASQVSTTLKSYAKTTDLSGLATEKYVTSRGYQTASQITTTLAAYAKTSQLNGLATETFVTNKGYQTASQVSTTLSSYVKTSTLSGYATVATVNAIKSTANTNKATISTNTGKISTIEQNVSGLQTTVASKASQSQVTQLATGLSAVVSKTDQISEWTRSYSVRTANPKELLDINGDQLSKRYSYEITLGIPSTGTVTNFMASLTSNSAVNAWTLTIHERSGTSSNHPYVYLNSSGYPMVSLYSHTSYYTVEVTIKRIASRSKTSLTMLSDNINLRVTKNDIINQINISTEGVLIGSAKNKLNITATTTYIANATIKSAHIADLAVTNAKIANGTIASAKIASLDAAKISTGTLKSISVDSVTITGSSISGTVITSNHPTDGSSTRITSGLMEVWNDSNNKTGSIGVGYGVDNPTISGVAINLEYGKEFQIRRRTAAGASTFNQLIGMNWNLAQFDIRMDTSFHGKNLHAVGRIETDKGIGLNSSNLNDVNRLDFHSGVYVTGGIIPITNSNIGLFSSGFLALGVGNHVAGTTEIMRVQNNMVQLHKDIQMNRNNIEHVAGLGFRNARAEIGRLSNVTGTNDLGIYSAGSLMLGVHGGGNYATTMKLARALVTVYTNLSMNGNSISNQSDERLKRDIKDVETDSLTAIEQWRFVGFNWIDNEMDNRLGRQFGLIAQETPELSMYDVSSDTWSINSSKQIMMNSHAIQQLASKVSQATESNEDKIHQLQQELSKANRRIEELEGVM